MVCVLSSVCVVLFIWVLILGVVVVFCGLLFENFWVLVRLYVSYVVMLVVIKMWKVIVKFLRC